MVQQDNTAKKLNETSVGSPAPVNENLAQYLQQIQAYRDTIRQVADVFRNEHWIDIVKNPEKIKIYETQIIGIINSLKKMGTTPTELSSAIFKKETVVNPLTNARVELSEIMFLLQVPDPPDPQVAKTSFKHFPDLLGYLEIVEQLLQDYLDQAKKNLIPSELPPPQGD